MNVYAYHDLNGNIRSVVVAKVPPGARVMLTPKPGIFVAEIEDHGLKAEEINPEALRDIAKNYKIAMPLARSTLVKKE